MGGLLSIDGFPGPEVVPENPEIFGKIYRLGNECIAEDYAYGYR